MLTSSSGLRAMHFSGCAAQRACRFARRRRPGATVAIALAAWLVGSFSAFSDETTRRADEQQARQVRIQPRYHRWHVDPGVEWVEKNTDYAHLDWQMPIDQAALVLVDVWDRHYLKDTEARSEEVIEHKLAPLVAACREAGLRVIHAPSPAQARGHPNWVGVPPARNPANESDAWPPAQFRRKSGEFAQFGRPVEPRAAELAQLRSAIAIHPKVLPVEDEAVVATGDELHKVCQQNKILFLLYAGFNTNACILTRDYGTMAMGRRGYEIIIVRDCTTGMESCRTQSSLGQTQGAILFLEMFGKYSIESAEVIEALDDWR